MYILILEDGDVRKSETIDDGELMAAEDGYLDIIDLALHDNPLRYFDGKWQEIESVNF